MTGRLSSFPFLLAVGAIAGLTLTGCASMVKYFAGPGGTFQDIPVTSTPPGASVLVDGEPAGITPLTLRVPRWESHDVRVELAGYQPRGRCLTKSLNPIMLFDLIFLHAAPFAVGIDFALGAWDDYLQPGRIHFKLRPGDGPAAPAMRDPSGGCSAVPRGDPALDCKDKSTSANDARE